MVKSARVISPPPPTSLSSRRFSPPPYPLPSKGRKMSLCFECERRDCVCSQPTDESLSITSEDDLPQGGVFKTQERDLSFISGDESEAENDLGSSGLLPPPAKDQSSHPPTSQRELLFPPPPSHQDTRSADCSDPLEKEVKVSDFRPQGAQSSYADLSVWVPPRSRLP